MSIDTLYIPPISSSPANPLDNPPQAAAASGTPPTLTVNGSSTNFTPGFGARTVAPSLTVTGGNDTVIDGARVIINSGFDATKDQLLVGNSTATNGTINGINYSYDSTSGVLTFTGDSTTANYQSALQSVKFDTSSNTTASRSIDFSLGTKFYLGSNGHFYGFVPVTIPNQPNKGISWINAKAEAESSGSKFYTLDGYLATITSQAEQDFINNKIKANGWIGASDSDSEGTWKWVTGPEAGTVFWNGQGATFGTPKGTPVNGNYSNWSPGTSSGNDEPNDRQSDEDYAHIIGNSGAGTVGKWNDLANDFDYSSAKDFQVQGYIIEYGDKITDANYPKIVGSVSVNIGSQTINPDLNKDQRPEIVWRNFGTTQKSPDSGRNAVWVLDYDKNTTDFTKTFTLNAQTKYLKDTISDLGWKIEGTQDFNKDGITDFFWHNTSTNETAIWVMKNDTNNGGIEIDKGYVIYTIPEKGWEVKGVADFDNDGNQNILWQNSLTGANAIWSINYDANNTATPFSIDSNKTKFLPSTEKTWKIKGWADFNKDNVLDILWSNDSTGENAVWTLNNNAAANNPFFGSGYYLTNTGKASGWRVEEAIDFNNDGVSDILWRNTQTGEDALWLMKSGDNLEQGYVFATTDRRWEIEGVADFTQDNIPDILWRNYATGDNAIWRMKLDTGKIVLDQGFLIAEAKDLSWQVEAPNPNNRDVLTT